MKAIIMAGGRGSRLHGLTVQYPKPMLPFLNKPVLAHILNLLKYHRITEVVITVQYLAEQIWSYFGDGHTLGMVIHYAVEETPLGTAGSVKNAQPYLDNEPFLVISGDIITDIDLSGAWQFHQAKEALATLVLKRVTDPLGYGIVVTDWEGRIRHYLEKPDYIEVVSSMINTGIYILDPEVLNMMKPNRAYDFSYDIFPQLVRQNAPIFGCLTAGYWGDMGSIQGYMAATADALMGRVKHIDRGIHIGGNIWVGRDVEIAPDAVLRGPIYLGNEVRIHSGAIIHGPSVVGDQTIIGPRAFIERSIIGHNCWIGEAIGVYQDIIFQPCQLTMPVLVGEEHVRAVQNVQA
jgi:mannose-1-phosphate guanylyltransferase/phosphomannomutase